MKTTKRTTRVKTNLKTPPKKKTQKKKVVFTTMAIGTMGIIGYFSWQYVKKKKESNANKEISSLIMNMDQPIVATASLPVATAKAKKTTRSVKTVAVNDDFPLKKGSKGANVKRLQEALIAKYGKQVLPKYGADGDFGQELSTTLKKLSLPSSITESMLNVLLQGTTDNLASVGKDLYKAAEANDFSGALRLLKKIKNTEDYTTANNTFKQERISGVRQTIVNGLLNVFISENQKQPIKLEFLRIGLQFDGSKWSLSGFDGLPIMTTTTTTIWINATSSVRVPARMVLGNEVSRKLDYTLFENGGRHFLVQTKSVKYL